MAKIRPDLPSHEPTTPEGDGGIIERSIAKVVRPELGQSLSMAGEDRDRVQERSMQFEVDLFRFQYGWLEDSHPTQQYVAQLATRLPQRHGLPLKVRVLPQWKETNAISLPDGTILIGSKMLKDVDSEEALLGVIAHEYVHAYRSHVDKQNDKRDQMKGKDAPRMFKTFLEQLGQSRVHEYEADLRGALIDLEKAGISPLGYQDFLMKLHDRHGFGGFTHGSSMDRALNISTAIHVIDFASLGADLHPMNQEAISALDTQPVNSLRNSIQRPGLYRRTPAELKKEQERRIEGIEALPPDVLKFALREVWAYIAVSDATIREDPSNVQAFQRLAERFVRERLPAFEEETTQELVTILALEFVCGIPVAFRGKSKFSHIDFDGFGFSHLARELMDSPEALERARLVLESLLEHPPETSSSAYSTDAWKSLIEFVLAQRIFHDPHSGKIDDAAFLKFADSWSDTLERWSATLDQSMPVKKEAFLKMAKNLRDGAIPGRHRNLPPTPLNPEDGMWVDHAARRFEEVRTPDELIRLYPTLVKELFARMKGRSLLEIGVMIDAFLGTVGGFDIRLQNDQRFSNILYEAGPGTIALDVFTQCLTTFPSLKATLSDLQRRALILNVASHLDIPKLYANGKKRKKILSEYFQHAFGVDYDSDDEDVEEEQRQFIRERQAFLRRAQEIDPLSDQLKTGTVDDLLMLHKFLLDEVYYRDHIPINLVHFDNDQAKSAFINLAIAYFSERTLPQFIEDVARLEGEGVPISALLEEAGSACGPLILRIVDALKDGSMAQLSPGQQFQLSRLISDPILKGKFQQRLLGIAWERMSFDEKMEVVLAEDPKQRTSNTHIQERFFEGEVRTSEQFERVKTRLSHQVDHSVTEGGMTMGVATVVSSLNLAFTDLNTLFEGLMESGTNDVRLKKQMYAILCKDSFKLVHVTDSLHYADQMIRLMYNLDQVGRQLLLRALLVSDHGILHSEKKRQKFFQFLFTKWLKPDPREGDIQRVLGELQNVLETSKEWELLYFALQGALQDRIAAPPPRKKMTPWTHIWEVREDLTGESDDPKAYLRRIEGTLWTKLPASAKKAPWNDTRSFVGFAHRELYKVLGEEEESEPADSAPVTPLVFVKDVASKIGAMGVRFLQLLGQFVSLPPHYEQEFNDVYDRIKGQSKLSAIALLNREWPDMWDTIEAIEERVGGGSMVTVYKVRLKTGEAEVIKVRNPNIEYHLREASRFAEVTLDELVVRFGPKYAPARTALDDIKEWIHADIGFEGFLDDDRIFKERYDGFSAPGHDYAMHVPTSTGPSSAYFQREEWIEGSNLTQWEALEAEGHDMKQVSSLLTKCFIRQIMDGQVHSDVHVGNFRITPEKKIAILDRNFFLKISDEEKTIIQSFLNPFMAADEKVARVSAYFLAGAEIETGTLIPDLITAFQSQDWDAARNALIELKQRGVKIPLNFTLLMKNFNALQGMAKRAGLASLTHAFFYTPS